MSLNRPHTTAESDNNMSHFTPNITRSSLRHRGVRQSEEQSSAHINHPSSMHVNINPYAELSNINPSIEDPLPLSVEQLNRQREELLNQIRLSNPQHRTENNALREHEVPRTTHSTVSNTTHSSSSSNGTKYKTISALDQKLKGENFHTWKTRARNAIDENEMWEGIMDLPYEEDDHTVIKVQHKKVYGFLIKSIDDIVLSQVSHIPDSRPLALWKALCKLYERDTISIKMTLNTQLQNEKYKSGEHVNMYIARVSQIISRLQQLQAEPAQEAKILSLVNGIKHDKNFSTVCEIILQTDNITFENAKRKLLDKYDHVVAKLNLSSKVESEDDEKGMFSGDRRSFNPRARNNNLIKYCSYCNMNNHSTAECGRKPGGNRNNMNNFNRNERRSNDDSTPRRGNRQGPCWVCGKSGHIAVECNDKKGVSMTPQRKNNRNDRYNYNAPSNREHGYSVTERSQSDVESNHGSDEDEEAEHHEKACSVKESDVIFPSDHAHRVSDEEHMKNNQHEIWYMDSACTSHLKRTASSLENTQSVHGKSVTFADGQHHPIKSVGEYTLGTQRLSEVKHVPHLIHNLLSVPKLTDMACGVYFHKDGVDVIDEKSKKIIMSGKRKGNLYVIDEKALEVGENIDDAEQKINHSEIPVEDIDNKVSATPLQSQVNLFHHRLGHPSSSTMKRIVQYNSIDGMEPVDSKVITEAAEKIMECESCRIGKATRATFQSTSSRISVNQPGERIFSDVTGPIKIDNQDDIFHALGKKLYLQLFVDDYSSFRIGVLLKSKEEASQAAIDVLEQIKNYYNRPVKYFHTDGGSEIVNKEVKAYLKKNGTKFETTCPETPEHNGRAERQFRTIFEMVRCMLYQANLKEAFWPELAMSALHLLNLRVSSRLPGKYTPYELWYKYKPSIKRLRVVGCDAFVYARKHIDRKNKLEPAATKCIFLGYDGTKEMGYRCFDYEKRKMIISCHVKFNESSYTCGRINGASRFKDLNEWEAYRIQSLKAFQKACGFEEEKEENKERITSVVSSITSSNSIPATKPPRHTAVVSIPVDPTRRVTRSLQKQMEEEREPNDDISSTATSRRSTRARHKAHHYGMVEMGDVYDEDLLDMSSVAMRVTDGNGKEEWITPMTIQEAWNCADGSGAEWKKSTDDEYNSLIENKVWELVELPPGRKAVQVKWVFQPKINSDGTLERRKSRFVVKGYSQKEGIDYHDTYAPVAKLKTIRLLILLANCLGYKIKHLDVKTAFLYAKMLEEIYIEQPEGYEVSPKDKRPGRKLVCKLLKSLYGTKQAPRNWNLNVNQTFIDDLQLKRCQADPCLYLRRSKSGALWLVALWVDDIIAAYPTEDETEWLEYKEIMTKKYKMTDKGDVEWILGIKIERNETERTIMMSQVQYIEDLLKCFGQENSKEDSTPELHGHILSRADCPTDEDEIEAMKRVPYRAAIGKLSYLASTTRPDITHAVHQVSQYQNNPGRSHWEAVKKIIRYLKGTKEMKLTYHCENLFSLTDLTPSNFHLSVYTDSDWGGNHNDGTSTTGYLVQINGQTISWGSKKQHSVALSTAEAEYMALTEGAKELLWQQTLLLEILHMCAGQEEKLKIGKVMNEETAPSLIKSTLYCDNQAAVAMVKNETHHQRSKHIALKYHFIREKVENKKMNVEWVNTQQQLADIFTKPLPRDQFHMLKDTIMHFQAL